MDQMARIAEAVVGRYQPLRAIGRGGSATVYLARDCRHDRDVALKVLHPELAATMAAERFLREIATTARLNHPHILPLLDSGQADGLLYFVTPYVPGESLRERIRRQGPLPIAEAIRIVADVADALAAAHEAGVIHRDIKPENILISGRHAVVTDFGVARAMSAAAPGLTTGMALGTPSYMAPEQAMADPALDHRVDLYALGVLAYELLTGKPPVTGETPQEILTAHVVGTVEPVENVRTDTPAGLASLVGRCLAKHPDDRWQAAEEVVVALDPLTTPSSGTTPAARPPRRPTWLAAVGLTVLVAGAGGLMAAREAGRVRVLTAATRAVPEPITFTGDVGEAAVSPDGMFLALVRQDSSAQRLVVADRRGGTPILVATATKFSALRWSGDGARLFYREHSPFGQILRSIPRLGGTPKTYGGWPGSISPDGRRVAVLPSATRRLRVLDLESGDSTVTDLPAGRTWAIDLVWNPRGDRIAVLTSTTDRLAASILISIGAGQTRELALDTTAVLGIGWTPAGDTLVYLAREGSQASLYGQPLSSKGDLRGQPVLLATGLPGFEPSSEFGATLTLTADGRQLVYARRQDMANAAIATVTSEGDVTIRELTRGTANYKRVVGSPDGRRVAFIRTEPGRRATVGVIPIDGGPETTLLQLQTANDLAWSTDGTRLAVSGAAAGQSFAAHIVGVESEGHQVFLPDAASDEVTWLGPDSLLIQRQGNQAFSAVGVGRPGQATTFLDRSPGWLFAPRLDRSRRRVAYYAAESGTRGIWLADRNGGERRALLDYLAFPLRWGRDDQVIYAVENALGDGVTSIWTLPVAGGSPVLHARMPFGFVADDITADGRTVFGHRLGAVGDAWMVKRRPTR